MEEDGLRKMHHAVLVGTVTGMPQLAARADVTSLTKVLTKNLDSFDLLYVHDSCWRCVRNP